MDREYLKNAIQGPIATVPTPFDDDFNIDYGVMADLTKWWVYSGLIMGTAVIKVAAAMGEGPMLADNSSSNASILFALELFLSIGNATGRRVS